MQATIDRAALSAGVAGDERLSSSGAPHRASRNAHLRCLSHRRVRLQAQEAAEPWFPGFLHAGAPEALLRRRVAPEPAARARAVSCGRADHRQRFQPSHLRRWTDLRLRGPDAPVRPERDARAARGAGRADASRHRRDRGSGRAFHAGLSSTPPESGYGSAAEIVGPTLQNFEQLQPLVDGEAERAALRAVARSGPSPARRAHRPVPRAQAGRVHSRMPRGSASGQYRPDRRPRAHLRLHRVQSRSCAGST